MNPILDAALRYADNEWPVLPLYGVRGTMCECGKPDCGSPGKHPRTPQGVLDASTDEATIRGWWVKWPRSNVGIRTGRVSGLYVLDVDNKESVDDGLHLRGKGDVSLELLEAEGGVLPETLVSRTGSGGRHLVYAYPPDRSDLGNRAGLRPGLDTRGDQGYIVAPPSVYRGGGAYRWEEEGLSPAPLPPAWVRLLTAQPTAAEGGSLRDLAPGEKIAAGEGRHEWLFKKAAQFRGEGGTLGNEPAVMYGALMALNHRHLSPPLADSEVEHVVDSVFKRYQPNPQEAEMVFPPHAVSAESDLEADENLGYGFGTLMSLDLPPLEPLVDQLIDKGTGVIFGGQPNVGKSWVMMHLALAVATGTPFLGHFPTHKGRVLLVDEEGSLRADRRRLDYLVNGMSEMGAWEGSAWDLEHNLVAAVGTGVKLDNPKGVAKMRRMLDLHRPDLVIFDSLTRMHGGEESSNRDMAKFFEQMKLLMTEYGTTFLFVHHVRKPGTAEEVDPTWMLRGASDIQGWPETVFVLRPGDDATEVKAYNTKQREKKRLDPFVLRMFIDGDDETAKLGYVGEVEKEDAGTRRLDILHYLMDAEYEGRTARKIAIHVSLAERTVKKYLDLLVEDGAVSYETNPTTKAKHYMVVKK